jgi:two-component system chemotaxis response regulator CheB
VLWEIADGEYLRFRCRVGHAYSPETMLGAQSEVLEEALWSALKTLEESALLSKRLASSERERGHKWMMKRFQEREAEARERAEVIRKVLGRMNSTVPVESAEPRESSQ